MISDPAILAHFLVTTKIPLTGYRPHHNRFISMVLKYCVSPDPECSQNLLLSVMGVRMILGSITAFAEDPA